MNKIVWRGLNAPRIEIAYIEGWIELAELIGGRTARYQLGVELP